MSIYVIKMLCAYLFVCVSMYSFINVAVYIYVYQYIYIYSIFLSLSLTSCSHTWHANTWYGFALSWQFHAAQTPGSSAQNSPPANPLDGSSLQLWSWWSHGLELLLSCWSKTIQNTEHNKTSFINQLEPSKHCKILQVCSKPRQKNESLVQVSSV